MIVIVVALFVALVGVVVNHLGSCDESANEIIFARGLSPSSLAFSKLIRMIAAAPSLMVDAFPAVTVPSFLKTGFNFLNLSI